MAFENLTKGHRLTEGDVIYTLRQGRNGSRSLARRARNVVSVCSENREDLIASAVLSAQEMREAVPSNHAPARDRIPEVLDEVDRLMAERRRWAERELADIVFAESVICRIWDAYYRLEPADQEVLEGYYLENESAVAVAERLKISESTFWRRRRKSVRRILNSCSRSSPRRSLPE